MAQFLGLLLAAPEVKLLLSSEHFSVDGSGTAGKEKKRAKGDFRGLLLSNQSHRSSSDGEAWLFRRSGGTGAFLIYLGHCLMENRHGLVVASEVTAAEGYGERPASMARRRSGSSSWSRPAPMARKRRPKRKRRPAWPKVKDLA